MELNALHPSKSPFESSLSFIVLNLMTLNSLSSFGAGLSKKRFAELAKKSIMMISKKKAIVATIAEADNEVKGGF